jgi:O-antigen ligase
MQLIQPLRINPILAMLFLSVTASSLWLLTTSFYLLAVVPVLALWLLFILGRRPELGFYIIIFMVPLDVFREMMGSGSTFLSISKIIGIYLIGIYLFYLLLNRLNLKQLQTNLWPSIFFLAIGIILSVFFSMYPLISMEEFKQFVTAVIIFTMTLLISSEDAFFKKIPYVIIAGIGVSVAFEVAGFFFDIPLFFMASEIKRGLGAMQNPNHLAAMIIFSIPFIIHKISQTKRQSVRLLGISFILLLITGLILTYSRSAFIVALLLGIMLIWEYKRYFKAKIVGFIIIGTLLLSSIGLLLIPSSYWERQRSLSIHDSSVSSRFSYIIVGWEAFKKSPVVGTGLGTFATIYADSEYAFSQSYRKTREQTMRAAHNSYLELLVCTGLTGFIPFLCMIWITISNFRRASAICLEKGLSNEAAMINAYKIGFYTILIFFFFLSSPYLKYFWLCAGLSFFALQSAKKLNPSSAIAT